MKPILHLLGDKYKAAKYIKFAERKLAELKHFMAMLNMNVLSRSYRFTSGDIEIYIESFRGIDKIRIKAAKEAKCIITAIFVAVPASTSEGGGEYDSAIVSVTLNPSKLCWIAWNDTPEVEKEVASRPGEFFLYGGSIIGTNDDIVLTVTDPDTNSQTERIDVNNNLGVSSGIQNVIFGSAMDAPDVYRKNPPFGSPPDKEFFLNEGGSHNDIFSKSGAYEFQFSFINRFGADGSHGNIYLLIASKGPVIEVT